MIRSIVLLIGLLMFGCTNADVSRYDDVRPRFDPMAFFQGETHASGVYEARDGSPLRRFTQVITGRRDGDALIIDQTFSYEDGETEDRTWRLTRLDETTYEAVSDAARGAGVGRVYGDVFVWEWTYRNARSPLADLKVKQWMYRHDEAHVTNRVMVTKFGLRVAEVSEYFRKPEL